MTRVVVCRGVYCNQDRRADKNFQKLKPHLDALGVKYEIASCLSMCGAGPNLIVYPGKVICNHVTEDDIPRIVDDHLSGES